MIQTKLSKFTSYIFHPLFFPTYGALLVLWTLPQYFAHLSNSIAHLSVIVIFIMTALFPIFSLLLMSRLELISSIHLPDAKERIIPMVAIGSFYIWTYFYYRPSYHLPFANPILANMLLAAILALFSSFIFTLFKKVSLHAVGAGSLVALLLVLSKFSIFDLRVLVLAFIILAGLIGTARLILKAHDQKEIWIGYLIGFFSVFFSFYLVPEILNFIQHV